MINVLYKNKGYPVSTKIPHPEISVDARRFPGDLPVGNRFSLNGLLKQAIEEQSARTSRAPVKAKDELVEIMVQLRRLDRTLVRAEQPTLK